MDMNTGTDPRDLTGMAALPKAPRKPRPSEVAARKAKAKRPKVKAKFKPKAKKALKAKRPKVKKAKVAKRKTITNYAGAKVSAGVVRTERLDLRLLPKEKAKLLAKAKTTRRTVTSVVQEMIEKLK